MGLEKFDLYITHHAYEQYCDRVEAIEYGALRARCTGQIDEHDYTRKREFIHLDGVWWVFNIHGEKLHFVTCYGRSHFDMPAALGWAKLAKDRINLRRIR